jgi:hypothetical protein
MNIDFFSYWLVNARDTLYIKFVNKLNIIHL